MKLSQYTKQQDSSYRAAVRWWRAGARKGYQAPTGTIVHTEGETSQAVRRQGPLEGCWLRAALSAEHKDNLDRQAARLADYCTVRGSQVAQVVKEIASGANDSRPKLLALLKDTSVTREGAAPGAEDVVRSLAAHH